MERYSEYKESGVEWIGKIPHSWALQRINNVFTERTEKVSDLDYEPLSVTKNGIFPQLENVAKSDNHDNRKLVKSGDFVINSRSDRRGSSGVSNLDGSVSLINIVITPKNTIKPRYSELMFKSYEFINEYYRNGRGIVADLWSTRYELMKNISICLPPLNEQEQIVAFLDDKTEKIDDLLAKTKKKIELLKEKRTTLINQCVTKGLNPNAPMKDSGVEWIGEIPSGWELVRLNVLGEFSKGKGITKEKIKEKGYQCIRNGEIYTTYNRISNEIISFIDENTTKESVPVKKGTLLFTGDGETKEEIGKCLLYNGNETLYVGGGINIFTITSAKVEATYLSFLMNSESVVYQKSRDGKGEIVVHIYSKQLREIKFGLPPIEEQEQIVDYLDEQTSKIDCTISNEEKRIELLKEYRQSLISNVVTGKIKVCN